MPSSVTDEELEIMEQMDQEDLLDYGIKIKQESELLDHSREDSDDTDEVEYLNPVRAMNPHASLFKGPLNMQGGLQKKEPTYTLEMHLFHKRKDKPPLYLLNPDDYPQDPQKQLQIRRATITYRHHQEKKELIRRLTEENANLKSVLDIYTQREEAMSEFCTCESAKKIIKDFDPRSFLIELPPLPKPQPLPPIRRYPNNMGQSLNGSMPRPNGVPLSSRNIQSHADPKGNPSILRRHSSVTVSNPSTNLNLQFKVPQTTQSQVQHIIRSHQERLNRMQSPVQQAMNPVSFIKTEPSDDIPSGKSQENPEVHKILQQMQIAQIRLDIEKKKEPCVTSVGGNLQNGASSIQVKAPVPGPNPIKIVPSVPQISSSVIARTGLRIQTPDGIKIIDASTVRFLPRSAVNLNQLNTNSNLIPAQFKIVSSPIANGISSSSLKLIPQNTIRLVQQGIGSNLQSVPGAGINISTMKFLPNSIALDQQSKLITTSKTPQPNSSTTAPISIIPKDKIEIVEDISEGGQTISESPTSPKQDIANGVEEASGSLKTSPMLLESTKNEVPPVPVVVIPAEIKSSTENIQIEAIKPKSPTPNQSLDVQNPTTKEPSRKDEIKPKEPVVYLRNCNQRRSQRSSALCQPNAKDLLKGIIKKIPRTSGGNATMEEPREDFDLTYARPAKKRKQSISS